MSCYEAGRDGFWIHRALTALGIENRVVDSSSIEVNRRARRTKTDRLDALKLVRCWCGSAAASARVWREVRVPTAADGGGAASESRADGADAGADAAANQIGSWLATCGCGVPPRRAGRRLVDDGARLGGRAAAGAGPSADRAGARRGWRWSPSRSRRLDAPAGGGAAGGRAGQRARRGWCSCKGVATTSASVLLDEGLVWRAFQNRRQLGGLLGFAPAKYESGESSHDQGISRAGNTRLQSVMVQLAWSWVHWQPQSALTRWYRARFGTGNGRAKSASSRLRANS